MNQDALFPETSFQKMVTSVIICEITVNYSFFETRADDGLKKTVNPVTT